MSYVSKSVVQKISNVNKLRCVFSFYAVVFKVLLFLIISASRNANFPFSSTSSVNSVFLWKFFKAASTWAIDLVWKVSKYGVLSGPYFPAFGLNTERYSVSLHIQFNCGKIGTRKNSVFGHFSRSGFFNYWDTVSNISFPRIHMFRCTMKIPTSSSSKGKIIATLAHCWCIVSL